ncbi:MAG: HAD hydrolase family protein [Thermoanaerobaculia bacterium]|nr:HAD hydrolase family protein [Thermoanaerobaculia bacterium]
MPILSDDEMIRRAGGLRWILSDVDGVLTDGGLTYDRRGAASLTFDVKDGMGLKLAQRAGLQVGLLSSRSSDAAERRAAELGLDGVHLGIEDKGAWLDRFLDRQRLAAREIAYIGDDLADLVVLGRCGLAFAPADAVAEVKAVADRVLDARGGRGAVREMVERILRARGDWERVLAPFTFERR